MRAERGESDAAARDVRADQDDSPVQPERVIHVRVAVCVHEVSQRIRKDEEAEWMDASEREEWI